MFRRGGPPFPLGLGDGLVSEGMGQKAEATKRMLVSCGARDSGERDSAVACNASNDCLAALASELPSEGR